MAPPDAERAGAGADPPRRRAAQYPSSRAMISFMISRVPPPMG